MTFKGRSNGKGKDAHIGHVRVHFKALIMSRSATRSIFTYTQVGIALKPFHSVIVRMLTVRTYFSEVLPPQLMFGSASEKSSRVCQQNGLVEKTP